MVQRLTPEERAGSPVSSIMRGLGNTVYFEIPQGKKHSEIKLEELLVKLKSGQSRLPVVDSNDHPLYMIHDSNFNKYIASGGGEEDSLDYFIETQKQKGIEFGFNQGYVIVSEMDTIAKTKQVLESASSCQDVFVTKQGGNDEPLLGWISNVRLGKFLKA
jgi:hypothetical protein